MSRDPHDITLAFPTGFLWGTATSAHQVEGNNRNNDWWAFEGQPGSIWHGDRSGLACDWWRRAEDDFDLMAEMGHTTHRLSVEWSRIEPKDGVFDSNAVTRYREMLSALRQRGIEPMVTLFHFTTPLWLARRGGWRNEDSVACFRRYARYACEHLGDLVKLWCPINEPNVYASLGYLFGEHSPGLKSLRLYFRVLRHLLRAHGAAYRVIHALDGSAQVGLAKSMQVFDPLDPASRASVRVARLFDRLVNGLTLHAVVDGRLGFPMSTGLGVHGPLVDSTDFIGVNYYNRRRVGLRGGHAGRLPVLHTTPGAEVSDYGRNGTYGEIYPEGLYRVLKRAAALGKPIYVTENGLPDADDDQRPRFILTHLHQLHRAIGEGVDVRGYYHWSFLDNFEWSEGWSLRFGLVALDQRTQARVPRRSAQVLSEIIRANAISWKLVKNHAPEALSDVFPPTGGRLRAAPGAPIEEQA
ncbi:glycoside hydrolase family 1 protein [Chloroflexota bacterium]